SDVDVPQTPIPMHEITESGAAGLPDSGTSGGRPAGVCGAAGEATWTTPGGGGQGPRTCGTARHACHRTPPRTPLDGARSAVPGMEVPECRSSPESRTGTLRDAPTPSCGCRP